MKYVRVMALAGCVLACAWPGRAQQSVGDASISGRVVDPSGAAIAGVPVVARHTDTNRVSTAVTDQEGRFRFPYLRVGSYEIAVRQQGFQDFTRSLTLTVGSAFELPVPLAVGGLDARVTVTGDSTMLDAARSQVAGTVSQSEVRTLPLNGRNLLDLALLIPGVSPTNTGSTQMFAETSAVPGGSLSVGSQRNLSNSFTVDGLSANDDAAGLSSIPFSVDAVEQLQVVTSGGQAELGRALGGYVSVVTRSGTNALHGTAYGYFRDDRFNAANPLSGTTLPMTQSQYGGSLSGPVVKDRVFYFGNVEHRALDQAGLTTILPANVEAINRRLTETGYKGPSVTTGIYDNPVDATSVMGKVDHHVNGRSQLSLRYGLYDITARNSRGAGALNSPTAASDLDNLDQSLALGHTFTLSSRTVLETRAQLVHSDLKAPPSEPIGPAVSIAGVAVFGTSSGSPTRRVNTMYQVVNNLSRQAGSHAFKFGVDFLYNDDAITYPRAARGSYTFGSLAAFQSGRYNNAGFTQTFGGSNISLNNPNLGVYAQDEWKLTSQLTLNLGVRYDLEFLDTVNTDADNLSPRVGLAWSPSASRRTVVRASAGLFYDRVPLRPLANALLSAKNTTDLGLLRQIGVTLSPTQAGAPVFPGILGGVVPSVTLANLTTMDSRLQHAHSRQASVEVERQIRDHVTVSVGYQYLRGMNLLMAINQNVPACVAAGNNNGCRPNSAYANNSQYSSAGSSNYHAVHLSFLQRPSRWGHYRVSYSLSKSMNNLGEFFFSSPLNPLDVSLDWARSDDDQRHRLVVHGAVNTSMAPATTPWERVSHGFQASAVLQAYSALPFNVTSGVTTIWGTPGRPILDGAFIDRNAGVGSAFVTLGARLSRTVRLKGRVGVELLVEGFNLANRANVVTRNTNFGPGAYPDSPSATFGQITAVGESRSAQFGVRVKF